MMDELLLAICKNPDDDFLLQVYYDWLQDRDLPTEEIRSVIDKMPSRLKTSAINLQDKWQYDLLGKMVTIVEPSEYLTGKVYSNEISYIIGNIKFYRNYYSNEISYIIGNIKFYRAYYLVVYSVTVGDTYYYHEPKAITHETSILRL